MNPNSGLAAVAMAEYPCSKYVLSQAQRRQGVSVEVTAAAWPYLFVITVCFGDEKWFFGDVLRSPAILKGVRATETTSPPVDFRDQVGVYVLYDENFRLVYVGQAGNGNAKLFSRLKHHTKDSLADRWTRFSWFGITWVKQNGDLAAGAAAAFVRIGDILNHIEGILISSAEPPNNRQGGRFGKRVEQYLQYRDTDSLGPDLDTMVRQLWKEEQKRQQKVR